jgi:hypothetical protein
MPIGKPEGLKEADFVNWGRYVGTTGKNNGKEEKD